MTMKQKPQLGKGMAALLGGGPIGAHTGRALHEPVSQQQPQQTRTVVEHQPMLVPLEKIITNKAQPRKIFKEKRSALSISEVKEKSHAINQNFIQNLLPKIYQKDSGKIFSL